MSEILKNPMTEQKSNLKRAYAASILESMKVGLPQDSDKDNDKDMSASMTPCRECGQGTVSRDMDNVYTNQALKLELKIPAYVCSHCNTIAYTKENYRKILEAEEAADGRPYVKVYIANGNIHRYTIH